MTAAKLRAEAEAVLVSQTCGCHSAKCGATAGCPYCGDSVYLDSAETSCARAALALAELMPVLQALRSARYQDTMHGGGCREVSAVSSVLYALDRAEESLR